MRERDAVRLASGQAHAKASSDKFLQRRGLEETPDRKPADRDHKLGPEKVELAFEPGGAGVDLAGRGHAAK
jgi:hypothetical protein